MNDDVTEPLRLVFLQRMKELHLNQLQVAEKSGVSAPHLNLFLSGKRTMTVAKINAVCTALGGELVLGMVINKSEKR